MAVRKKYDRNVLGRGLDNIGSGRGLGLDALIDTSDIETKGTSNLNEIPLAQIEPNPNQPRHEFDEVSMRELANSIREIGIVTPITVRQTEDGKYQIIAGERRWRAAQMAGLDAIPAYVKVAGDEYVMEMALAENIQREDLNAIEIALAYQRLAEDTGLTQEKISEQNTQRILQRQISASSLEGRGKHRFPLFRPRIHETAKGVVRPVPAQRIQGLQGQHGLRRPRRPLRKRIPHPRGLHS